MALQQLDECRILVVEDEYLLADDLAAGLNEAGAKVIGPFACVADALYSLDNGSTIDAAVLDVNLRDEKSYPVADALRARDVPFLFMSAQDADGFPERFADITRCNKPLPLARIIDAIGKSVRRG